MKSLKSYLLLGIFICSGLRLAAQNQEYILHTVAKGETVYSISNRYGVSIPDLVRLNPDCDKVIRTGQTLKIPQTKSTATKAGTGTATPAARTGYIYHTIQPGETLFQLTQRYRVTAEAICKANPGLSAANFQAGKSIAIPPSTGEVEKAPTVEKLITDKPANSLTDCREMHKVKRKDTLYGIARKYGVTEDELKEANPELKNGGTLQKGTFLCIPYHVERQVQTVIPTNEELFRKNRAQVTHFNPMHIALVLPFSSNESAKRQSAVMFYNGFMLAVDSLKKQGVNMDITICDSGRKEEKLDSLFRENSLKQSNLLFCPQLEIYDKKASDFAKKQGIRLVMTRSDEVRNNPYLYVTNTDSDVMNADVADHFIRSFARANIIILDMKDGSARTRRGELTTHLKSLMDENRISYRFLTLEAGEEQIAAALSSSKQNVIVPNSANSALMKTALKKWQQFLNGHPQYRITFLGHQEWLREAQEMKAAFYALDMHLYSKWWFNPNNAASKSLAANYQKWFNSKLPTTMPSVPTIGFDTAYYFIKGLATYGTGLEQNLKQMDIKPYQNFTDFERVSNWGGFMNRKIAFIHFNKRVVNIEF